MTPLDPFRELNDTPRWVAWRNEKRGDTLTKVPYATSRRKAEANNPATWVTRDDAGVCAQKIVNGLGGGIGIELGDLGCDLHLCGLDLDSCIKDGVVAPWAEAIMQTAPSYAERSPSGTGVKVFFLAASEDVRPFLDSIGVPAHAWGCRRGIPGENAKDHGPAVECYLAGRYFTITLDHWPGSPDHLALLDADMLDHLAPLIPPIKSTTDGTTASSGDNSRSAVAWRKGRQMHRAGKSYDQMVAALYDDPETAAWAREKGAPSGGRGFKRIWEKAEQVGPVTLDDLYAHMPSHNYIYVPTHARWPASSVNARLKPMPVLNPDGSQKKDDKGKDMFMKAAAWLDRNHPVEEITWAPGEPMIIKDRLPMLEGGWVHRHGATTFNQYNPPIVEPGDPQAAQPWLDLVHLVYPDAADHILDWFAHRVQRPGEKINHALVFGGPMGIGKDTITAPVRYAVGEWNCQEVSPTQAMGRFNGYVKAVILRISEARDLGDTDRFKFYDHLKNLEATPPEFLRVDEKNLREYPVLNCCGVIITTNHKADGLYLPADDRRHFVAWSDLTKEDDCFAENYFDKLWAYYADEGNRAVAAYLRERDIEAFNPKAPPPKTAAFWAIADTNRAPEEAELADVLDNLGNPEAVTLATLIRAAETQPGGVDGGLVDWLHERKNRRIIPHRLEKCGYVAVRNPGDKRDGQWKIAETRQTVYARQSLSLRSQIVAAQALLKR